MVVQELWLLVSLAIAASTEECYPKVLPCMAVSSGHILVHYLTVGTEGDLLPLVGIIGDEIQFKLSDLWSLCITYSHSYWKSISRSITAVRELVLSLFRRDSRPERCLVMPALVYRGSHPPL